jgi:hypothetical protein
LGLLLSRVSIIRNNKNKIQINVPKIISNRFEPFVLVIPNKPVATPQISKGESTKNCHHWLKGALKNLLYPIVFQIT